MSWNYRVVKKPVKPEEKEFYLQIEEVYYDKDRNIVGFGEAPVPYGETVEEIRDCLKKMLEALNKDIVESRELYESKLQKNS